jgi:hypothetical protein
MDKKTKIIIGVVAVVAIVLVGYFILTSGDVTMVAEDAQITLPHNYSVDNNIVAKAGDVNVSFMPLKGTDLKFEKEFFGAIEANGKDAGYENITNTTINGYTAFDFAAHPDKLKNVSTERKSTDEGEAWTTYPPEAVAYFDHPVDHFRTVNFVKDNKVYTLRVYTDNPDTSLYTSEIDGIIKSIAPVKK